VRDVTDAPMPHSKTIDRAICVTFSRSLRAVRDAAEDDLLGGAAGKARRPSSRSAPRRLEIALLLGEVEHVAERRARAR